MNYDVSRIARIYDKVYSTKPNSPERTAALEKLSETDRENLFDYDMGVRSGRIKKPSNSNQEGENSDMNYEEFRRLSQTGTKANSMQAISKFAKQSPGLYAEYRERLARENDEALRQHNRRITGK